MKQLSRLVSGVWQFASRVSMKVPEGVAGMGMRPGRMTRMQSSAQMGLRGLRFLDKTSGGKEGWKASASFFDARQRHLEPDDGITKEQLKEFWGEMTDQNFDSRLRIFFDM